jgi:hypothetical protein
MDPAFDPLLENIERAQVVAKNRIHLLGVDLLVVVNDLVSELGHRLELPDRLNRQNAVFAQDGKGIAIGIRFPVALVGYRAVRSATLSASPPHPPGA